MRYQIEWSENKNDGWKVVSLRDEQGKIVTDVSVNRVGKKGDVFPNFDEVKTGATVEGELWTSSAGKNYLFPPKTEGNLGSKPAWVKKDPTAITKAMETKQRNITASMDRKELMILLSQANTFATEMTKTFFSDLGNDEWRDKWQENKMWFLANHATEEEYSEATAGRVIPS